LTTGACPNSFVCNVGGTACLTSCTKLADCASGFYCSGGSCVAQVATGPCTTNDACTTGICGANGTGHCCTVACLTSDATCGASDCDGTGACVYPSATTACGSSGCSGAIISSPSTCDGMGTCIPNFVDCSPYACSGTSCQTTCSASGGCGPGYLCDTASTSCCGPGPSGTLAVDSVTGDNTVVCCGTGSKTACKTVTQAMIEIDTAQAKNVTVDVSVDGGGGDWAPGAEVYPIVLGWGVELSAPGVYFLDPLTSPNGPPNTAILDVNFYSANDTVGYASIVGTAKNVIGVGMNALNTAQTDDSASIQVEANNTLFIANAKVNSSTNNGDSIFAIAVQPGATLTLGQDQSSGVTGTVTIGNALGNVNTDGWEGIGCNSDFISLGCIVNDATLVGQSSVIIEGQEDIDIDAEDFASISLVSSPVVGVAPSAAGFGTCPQKNDAIGLNAPNAAWWVNGAATVSLKNATVQCIGGTAFQLQATFNGAPTVTLSGTTIQNTDLGIFALAGSATVTSSTLNYNFIGVQQATDGTNNGAIDLSGGGNSVVCSSNTESSAGSTNPGIDVYNTSTANLKADNVTWDTKSPDYFNCDTLFASCVCNLTACSTAVGQDDMDAVEDSTNLGGITTTGNSQATLGCH
jgi:hypothetical protein